MKQVLQQVLRALDDVVRFHAATGRHRLVLELGVVKQTETVRGRRNLTVVRIFLLDLARLALNRAAAPFCTLASTTLLSLVAAFSLRQLPSFWPLQLQWLGASFLAVVAGGISNLFGSNGDNSGNSSSRSLLCGGSFFFVRFGLGDSGCDFLPPSVALADESAAGGRFSVRFLCAAAVFLQLVPSPK